MATVWVLKNPPEVLLEEMDGFLVCYSGLTGKTHILDAFPAEILRSLAGGPCTVAEVKHRLTALLGDEGDWFDKTDDVLAELANLQLLDARPA